MRALDQMLGWSWADNALTIETAAGTLRLEPLADDLIRLRVQATGWDLVLPSGAIAKQDWGGVDARVSERVGGLTLTTPRLRVEIGVSPIRLAWYEGDRLFAEDVAIEVEKDRVVLRRTLPKEEHFYGLGEKTGFLDKRGRDLEMWATDEPLHLPTADPLYQSIPFFIALREGKAHGLFLDSTARSRFDLGHLDPAATYTLEVQSAVFDSYVFAGPGMAEIISRYTELTGRMELPPLWTLGYHQCRWSYFPKSKVMDLAKQFRERDIPCDGLWLDIHYMDGYRVFTWDEERFPEPEGMIADLASQGFRLVTIVDPGVKVDEGYPVYEQGVKEGHFITNPDGSVHVGRVWPGAAAFPDFSKPSVRAWWGDLHGKAYLDKGVAGIWNDMNEPASFVRNAQNERTLPHDVLQGEEGRQVPHKDLHNAYGFHMARATHEGWKRKKPGTRPFILTRSGYAGIQRYAAVWMGDNTSWWEHLQMSMPVMMGMGLSGVPFVGSDVGGFWRDSSGELVARWIQLGAFSPFFRMHSAHYTRDQEPWSFGPEVEAIARKYTKLRYRLLPYLYSLFEEAHRTGLPVLRPLVLQYQNDPETYHISDQVMVGRDLLVAPIYQPGVKQRLVYLPEGNWYDFWTGEMQRGGRYVVKEAPLDTLPLFVRAGAVLPLGPEMPHTGAKPMETLTLHVYPGQGQFELYEDEGEGYGYERGVWARTAIAVNGTRIDMSRPLGGYRPTWNAVELLIHGAVGPVRVNDQPAPATPMSDGTLRVLVDRQGGFTVTA